MTSLHPLDKALALESVTPGQYRGHTSPGYWNMVGPYGGATAATALRAVLLHPQLLGEPLSLTVNFAAALTAGPFTVQAEPVRTNRSTQHWSVSILQTDAQGQPVVTTTANVMNIPVNTVFYTGSTSTATASRRRNLKGSAASTVSLFATTYVVVADMKISVPLSSTTSSSTSSLYTSLTSALTSSVTSGTYSSTLKTVSQELGATETVDASATAVTNGPEETTVAPSGGGGGSSGLSGGAIAGIVIGALAGLILLAALVYYVLHTENIVTKGASPRPNPSSAAQSSTAAGTGKGASTTVFATENPLAQRSAHATSGNEML